jgi:threonylcarbamoyladenosine tRNA methylthiotransferase MtaB
VKQFIITTLGCKVNQYDGQALAAALGRSGLTAADRRSGQAADLIVINTCCVTATAMRKSRQAIRKALRAAPNAAVLVMGCYADYDGRRIADLLAALGVPPHRAALAGHHGDLHAALTQLMTSEILGNRRDFDEPARTPPGSREGSSAEVAEPGRPGGCPCGTAESLGGVDGRIGGARDARSTASPESIRPRRAAVVKANSTPGDGLGPIDRFDGHQRAFVKVQDGCDAFCAYCVVPFTRPRVWSRGLAEILDECRRLVAGGHKEIVLCGVFLGAFGRLTAIRRKWQPSAALGGTVLLPDLLRAVARLPGLWRVRLSSLEPLDVTDELLAIAAGLPAVAPHFHLPLQSGSPRILRRMNRQYTVDDFRRTVDRIRSTLDRPALTTDVIVGFPGETDEDFAATLAAARMAGFAKIHSFPFSPVEGTAAWTYRHQAPPPEVVRARMAELAEVERHLARDFRKQFVGTTLEALVEEEEEEGKGVRYLFRPNGTERSGPADQPKKVPDPFSGSPLRAMTDRYLTVTFAPPAAGDGAALTPQVVRLRITRVTRTGLGGELVE